MIISLIISTVNLVTQLKRWSHAVQEFQCHLKPKEANGVGRESSKI